MGAIIRPIKEGCRGLTGANTLGTAVWTVLLLSDGCRRWSFPPVAGGLCWSVTTGPAVQGSSEKVSSRSPRVSMCPWFQSLPGSSLPFARIFKMARRTGSRCPTRSMEMHCGKCSALRKARQGKGGTRAVGERPLEGGAGNSVSKYREQWGACQGANNEREQKWEFHDFRRFDSHLVRHLPRVPPARTGSVQ